MLRERSRAAKRPVEEEGVVRVRGRIRTHVINVVKCVLRYVPTEVTCKGSEAVVDTAGGTDCVGKGGIECYSRVGAETGVTIPGPWGRVRDKAAILEAGTSHVKCANMERSAGK